MRIETIPLGPQVDLCQGDGDDTWWILNYDTNQLSVDYTTKEEAIKAFDEGKVNWFSRALRKER